MRNFLVIFFILFCQIKANGFYLNIAEEDNNEQDTVNAYGERYVQSTNFYDSLKYLAAKRKITKTIYDVLINLPKKPIEKNINYNYEIDNFFNEFAGKTIRNIEVVSLNVFSNGNIDTTSILSRAQNYINNTHIITKRNVILNNLTFKEGDIFNINILEDNERLLRRLPYIRDAKIYIVPDSINSKFITLAIITQDRWSRGFDVAVDDINSGNISLYDYNLLGYGHNFKTTIFIDSDYKPKIGLGVRYELKNIRHSFFDASFDYYKTPRMGQTKIDVQRNFYVTHTKYAGGLQLSKNYCYRNIVTEEIIYSNILIKYNYYDFWASRSFLLNKEVYKGARKRIIVSGRNSNFYYFDRPIVSPSLLYQYINRKIFLGSIAYSRLDYYKTNLVYNFGRTEDMPIGYLVELQGGREFNEFNNRYYSSLNIKYGWLVKKIGYFNHSFSMGRFRYRFPQQGIFRFDGSFISNLYSYDNFYFRNFFKFNYTRGTNFFKDEYITINDSRGIRGLGSSEMRGIERLNFSIESLCFSPIFLYGFRFVFYGFYDGGYISSSGDLFLNSNYYSGFGVGLRLRNDRLVFKTFQIRLMYYPTIPQDASPDWIRISGEEYQNVNKLNPGIPELIRYD